jgi:ubiquinone/menaquinone biosynthesis C-methylase UbiE
MKPLFLTLLLSFAAIPAMAQKKVDLSVNWVFTNIIEGYDHDCKMIIYVDGVQLKESTVALQSKKNQMSVEVSKGKHQIEIINYAFYEGNWEEHNIANDYSVDAFYKGEINFKKKPVKVSMVFDINTETADIKIK